MGESRSGDEVLEAMRRARGGNVHPVHEYLAKHDPSFLLAYDGFAQAALFGSHREQPALAVRYRELVISAVLASQGASAAGIASHLLRARHDGATDAEIMEAFEAASLPGGGPTLAIGLEALMSLPAEDTDRS